MPRPLFIAGWAESRNHPTRANSTNWQISCRDDCIGRQVLRTIKARIIKLFSAIDRHEDFLLSGSLAYTTGLALAPFVMIMLTVLSLLGPDSREGLVEQLTGLLGSEAGEVLKTITANAKNEIHFAGLAGVISFLVLAISASAIFSQLRIALDKINEYKAPASNQSAIRGFLMEKVFSIGLVFGFIILMIVSLGASSLMAAFFIGRESIIWTIASVVINMIVFSVLFTTTFHYVPSKRLPWARCALSGVVAAVFFLVGKNILGLYLGKSAVGSAYGAAGSFVMLLLWLYYMSFTILVAYEFSNQLKPPSTKGNP